MSAALLALTALPPAASAQEAAPAKPTPADVVAAAPATDWRAIDPADLLVMELAPDTAGQPRRVIIQLIPPPFSAGWTGNIRALARAHWWDGTSVYRVVDNWVAQWGDGEDDKPDAKPLPGGLLVVPESDYLTPIETGPEDGRDFVLTPEKQEVVINRWIDSYAITGFAAGWPIALDDSGGRSGWPVHCYGSVGVARDLSPDTGTGAELYAVIGHAPRALDRNIAVVGRVIAGIEHLSTLPRGRGEAGVYDDAALRVPIRSVRLGDELPPAERPHFEYLASDSASFARYLHLRANRDDDFYRAPAKGVDICNAPVPLRQIVKGN
ncbi:peptidylprolyl isomerase [Altererythrobacter xixiisoli]|uniref:Peptidylprolyl isomerase n=3 Tax=Croceibacterium xixiisoli TaxID=1476466 RepID=A0A6I4U133_9SPHN|nr:peptidylprolyl isomerase [Croceibacterium xixiisoli]